MKTSEKLLLDSKLTYGFELEGIYRKTLIRDLENNSLGSFGSDGSISRFKLNSDLPESVREFYSVDDMEVEFRSKVFRNHKAVIETLEMFTDANYHWDSDCGLHLHLCGVNSYIKQQLYNVMCNWDMVKKIQKFAQEKMCQCQKSRINKSRYCKPYVTKKQLLDNFQRSNDKYRFMYYRRETLEFRFFSTCEHKVENVKKFLEFVASYLTTKEQSLSDVADFIPDSGETIIKEEKLPNSHFTIEMTPQYILDLEKRYLKEWNIEGYEFGSLASLSAKEKKKFLNSLFKVSLDQNLHNYNQQMITMANSEYVKEVGSYWRLVDIRRYLSSTDSSENGFIGEFYLYDSKGKLQDIRKHKLGNNIASGIPRMLKLLNDSLKEKDYVLHSRNQGNRSTPGTNAPW